MTALDMDSATPRLRQAFDYWDGKRAGRPMPARADLDPAEIKPLLPYVVLLDVLRDAEPGWPLDFRYRLLGTVTDGMMNARYTGLCMSELAHQQPGSRIWQSLDRVTTTRAPHMNRVPYVGPHKDFMSVVDLVMPLSNDGAQVTMLFCIVDFVPRENPAYP
ncbi:MAG: PAS domain-containing protein [Ferrovibrio sp.]